MVANKISSLNEEKGEFLAGKLLDWFSTNARDFPWRKETSPYKILVAEKLLQQTTYGHVMKVYASFLEKFPDIHSLAQAEVSDIEDTIRRLGLHRQRAQQFKEIGSTVLSKYGGKIPSRKEELLDLSGIGDYVANAVLCFAFDRDEPVVDINVRRVVGRFFSWVETSDKEIERRLRRMIPEGRAQQFNWGIIDFSSAICSQKPKCKECFLTEFCSYYEARVR